MKNSAIALSLLLLASPVGAQDLPRADAVPGGIAVVPLGSAQRPMPAAYFMNHRVMVVRHGGRWNAVVGLPLSLRIGEQRMITVENGGRREFSFPVRPKHYAVQHLTLRNGRLVEPTADDLKRIERDRAAIRHAFTTWTPSDAPPTRFGVPLHGRLTSPFGLRRFFNNEPRQPHSGIDIAAPLGTPVVAPAPGIVVEVGEYFFNGKTVFLDHGQGLITMYNHLDRVTVPPGAHVKQGQQIGKVGMTGRATGPHLHWSVSLNDSRVNPLLFISQEALATAK